MNYCFSFFAFSHSFLAFVFVAEYNGNNMKLWEFRSSLIVIIEENFCLQFSTHVKWDECRYVICERWTTWNISHSNNARIQFFKCWRCELRLLLSCLNLKFALKSCICCCVYFGAIQTIHCYKWLKRRKRNSIFGKTEWNVLQQHLNDSLRFFAFKFKLKINLLKNYSVVIVSQFDWQLSEWLDKTILAPTKLQTSATGCGVHCNGSPLHSEFILNNENFICHTKQKTYPTICVTNNETNDNFGEIKITYPDQIYSFIKTKHNTISYYSVACCCCSRRMFKMWSFQCQNTYK